MGRTAGKEGEGSAFALPFAGAALRFRADPFVVGDGSGIAA
jgi:hypothetical protein